MDQVAWLIAALASFVGGVLGASGHGGQLAEGDSRTLTLALVGLAGIVLGGLISGLIQVGMEKYKTGRSVAAARRLVEIELHQIERTTLKLSKAVREGRKGNRLPPFSTTMWDDNREVLARGLTPYAWAHVAAAYALLPGEWDQLKTNELVLERLDRILKMLRAAQDQVESDAKFLMEDVSYALREEYDEWTDAHRIRPDEGGAEPSGGEPEN